MKKKSERIQQAEQLAAELAAQNPTASPSVDGLLGQRFVCPRCHRTGARVKRFTATGVGIARIFDIPFNEFIAAACQNCGYTELYDPAFLDGREDLNQLVDIMFGK